MTERDDRLRKLEAKLGKDVTQKLWRGARIPKLRKRLDPAIVALSQDFLDEAAAPQQRAQKRSGGWAATASRITDEQATFLPFLNVRNNVQEPELDRDLLTIFETETLPAEALLVPVAVQENGVTKTSPLDPADDGSCGSDRRP